MTIVGSRGKVLNKEIRAVVRMSEAKEIVITTRGMHRSLDSVFYTPAEARQLIRAIEDAMHDSMTDFEVNWLDR